MRSIFHIRSIFHNGSYFIYAEGVNFIKKHLLKKASVFLVEMRRIELLSNVGYKPLSTRLVNRKV